MDKTMKRRPRLDTILRDVSKCFKVDPSLLISKERKAKESMARYCFFHIANMFGYTDTDIGKKVSRDRTTVVYGRKQADNYRLTNYIAFCENYDRVEKKYAKLSHP